MNPTIDRQGCVPWVRSCGGDANAIASRQHGHRHIVALAVIASFPVQTACPERALSSTGQALAGRQAPRCGAPPGRRRPEPRRGTKAEGKIKGRGTSSRRKPCLHGGWRGTRFWRRCAADDAAFAPAMKDSRASHARLGWCSP
ncbi:MAG: hypothetical protein EPN49_11430 [Rhodanobacter sp.]|nr:MAG: hypothetical protein EPN49_11430 [Rhodanobacter sp.]